MPDLHATPLPTDLVAPQTALETPTAVAFLEGPAVHADGRVFFSDIWNNRILCFNPWMRETTVFRADSGRTNGNLFDHQQRLLSCEGNEFGPGGRRRLVRTHLATGEVEVVTERFEGKPYNSPNDVAARSNGQIFFTDPCYGDRSTMQLSHESVYCVSPTGEVRVTLTQPQIQRPNGIALSPDEGTLYVVDSCPVVGGNRKIWAFDLAENGDASHPRVVFDFAPGRGGDGMAVLQSGDLVIAAGIARPRGPHETAEVPPGVYVVSPQGQLRGRIPVPEDVLTNLTFGGDDLRTLYITAGKTLFAIRIQQPGWLLHRR